jgi:acetyl esterase/lipase
MLKSYIIDLENIENYKMKWKIILCNMILLFHFESNAQFQNGDKSPLDKMKEILDIYAIIPNQKTLVDTEIESKTDFRRLTKVSHPNLIIYSPNLPNGQALIICPGGGYSQLSIEKEGTLVAEELSSWGITAFVLKYRLPDDSNQIDKTIAPLQDAQAAIKFVRSIASNFGIDPAKIGIMGFSAGGHLASSASTHFEDQYIENKDSISLKPDFSILIYPVISFDSMIAHIGSRNNLLGMSPSAEKIKYFSNDLNVTNHTPPTFLVHAEDDKSVVVENSIRYYQACIKHQVKAEMHLYPNGKHGFGMNNPTTTDSWMDRLKIWLAGLD